MISTPIHHVSKPLVFHSYSSSSMGSPSSLNRGSSCTNHNKHKVSETVTVHELPTTVNTTTTTIQHSPISHGTSPISHGTSPVYRRQVLGPVIPSTSIDLSHQFSGTSFHSQSPYPTTISHVSTNPTSTHWNTPINCSNIAPTVTPIAITSYGYTNAPIIRRKISNPLITSPIVRHISNPLITSPIVRHISNPLIASSIRRHISNPLICPSATPPLVYERKISGPIHLGDMRHVSTPQQIFTTTTPNIFPGATHLYGTTVMGTSVGPYTSSTPPIASSITRINRKLPVNTYHSVPVNTYHSVPVNSPTINIANENISPYSTWNDEPVRMMSPFKDTHYEESGLGRKLSGPHIRSQTFQALKKPDPLTSTHDSQSSSASHLRSGSHEAMSK